MIDDEDDGNGGSDNGGKTRPCPKAFIFDGLGGGLMDLFFPCGEECDRITIYLPLSAMGLKWRL